MMWPPCWYCGEPAEPGHSRPPDGEPGDPGPCEIVNSAIRAEEPFRVHPRWLEDALERYGDQYERIPSEPDERGHVLAVWHHHDTLAPLVRPWAAVDDPD